MAKKNVDALAGLEFVAMQIPHFTSEKQEAEWWDSHPETILEVLRRGRAEGKITRGGITSPAVTKPITLRLESSDIERAKAAARRCGLRYQTYLRMIIHQVLQREEKAI